MSVTLRQKKPQTIKGLLYVLAIGAIFLICAPLFHEPILYLCGGFLAIVAVALLAMTIKMPPAEYLVDERGIFLRGKTFVLWADVESVRTTNRMVFFKSFKPLSGLAGRVAESALSNPRSDQVMRSGEMPVLRRGYEPEADLVEVIRPWVGSKIINSD